MLNIKKLLAAPVADGQGKYDLNTLFVVENGDNLIDLYMSSVDGTKLRHIATQNETIAKSIIYADEPPPLPCPSPAWFDTTKLVLYIQYNDGDSVSWVEPMSSLALPEFAGTGVENTMARSDHNHDETYLRIGALNW